VFLRLNRCNLYCSWCDTPYTWDWSGRNGTSYDRSEEETDMTVDEVVTALHERGVTTRLLVVTGGEPLLQASELERLFVKLGADPNDTEVETNGTRGPIYRHPVSYNVSPKLWNSGMAESVRIKPKVLYAFAEYPTARFKFVVCDVKDLEEIEDLATTYAIAGDRIWVMPESTTVEGLHERTLALADAVLDFGFNMTSRTHLLAWNGARGH
jgi:organic radical activating enzyme